MNPSRPEATVRWLAESRPCPICSTSGYRFIGMRGGAAHRRASGVDDHYDCVFLLNILEHLYSPLQVLRRVAATLRPGGIAMIGVPNEAGLATLAANTYLGRSAERWSANMSPTFGPFHVVGFTPKSLRRAVVDAGLEVASLTTVPGTSFLEPAPGLRRRVERTGIRFLLRAGALLGRGDAMTCWARRP